MCGRILVLLHVAFFVIACSEDLQPEAEPQVQRPNLLLIVADDLGFTDIGSFGSEIPTANLDDLASRGVRLANFHVAPVCSPTRAILMSGMDSHEAGMASMDIKRAFDNGKLPPVHIEGYGQRGYEGYLSPFVHSMPEVLQGAGYRTYMVGKWDLGRALVEEHNPAGRGFDRSFAQLTGTAVHMPDSSLVAHGGVDRADPLVFRRDWDVVETLPEDYYSSDYFTDELISFLNEDRKGAPFFAYLSFSAPHFPLQAPEEWVAKFSGAYDGGYEKTKSARISAAVAQGVLPDVVLSRRAKSKARAWTELNATEKATSARKMEVYAAMVANMDFNIGRILDQLRAQGVLDDTIILFMSDNGAAANFPPKYADGYDNSFDNLGKATSFMGYGRGWAEASTGPFRDVKGSLAEGGTGAAAILSVRDSDQGGTVSSSYVTVQDVMPTFLELSGADHQAQASDGRPVIPMRGKSMAGLMTNPDTAVHAPDEPIGWEFEGQRALVQGPFKILWDESEWMLFNLEDDPAEVENIASDNPEIVESLDQAWQDYADAVGVAR